MGRCFEQDSNSVLQTTESIFLHYLLYIIQRGKLSYKYDLATLHLNLPQTGRSILHVIDFSDGGL